MLRAILHILVLAPMQMAFSLAALGQSEQSFYLGAGRPGTDSFELGVGITSLIKVRLLPSDGIDLTLVETADREVVGDFLITAQEKIATLTGLEPITHSTKAELRSVMAFSPSYTGSGPALELLVRTDVEEDAVYLITKAILENGVFLEDLNKRSWNLSADQALDGLNLSLHPGAIRYYEEIGEANLTQDVAYGVNPENLVPIEGVKNESTFLVEFGDDVATLDQNAEKLIAEACQYATIFEAEKIRVAGLSKSSHDETHHLNEERINYVVGALRSNAGCASDIDIVSADQLGNSHGKPRLAIESNQVEVTIMLP